ncbi:MAG: nucleotidyltransferase domain-containing protein [Magnetococcales bacterium]|nr:nucleotidyltransferase domain-containing protein [Magnetococcales bacterium]
MLSDGLDLTAEQRELLLALLRRHLPDVATWAHGSRVTGKARPHSDLDLVVFAAPQQAAAIALLKEACEESLLPFRVDLLVWDELPESFQRNIAARHAVVWEGQEGAKGGGPAVPKERAG